MSRARGRRPGAARSLLLLSIVTAAALSAQTAAPPPDALAAMKPFESWVGEWRGAGWSVNAEGQRIAFDLTERVQPKAGGTVLLLEGHGHAVGDTARVTHHGVVLLYYDPRAGGYRWNGHELGWGAVEAEPRLVDGGLEWTLPAGPPGTVVRFTIQLDRERWREFGEVSTDGATWSRFMEMELHRLPRG